MERKTPKASKSVVNGRADDVRNHDSGRKKVIKVLIFILEIALIIISAIWTFRTNYDLGSLITFFGSILAFLSSLKDVPAIKVRLSKKLYYRISVLGIGFFVISFFLLLILSIIYVIYNNANTL